MQNAPQAICDLADEPLQQRYIAYADTNEYLLVDDLLNAVLDLADHVKQVEAAEKVMPGLASLPIPDLYSFAHGSAPEFSVAALLAARHFSPAQRQAIIDLACLVERVFPAIRHVEDAKTLIYENDDWRSLRDAAQKCLAYWA